MKKIILVIKVFSKKMMISRLMNSMSRKRTSLYFGLILFAFVLRVVFSQAIYPWIVNEIQPSWHWSQNDTYDSIAQQLVDHGSYAQASGEPTARRLPAYPLLLAAVYRIAPNNFIMSAQLVQALLSAVTVGLVLYLGIILLGIREGFVGALLYAVYPNAILYSARCVTEPLFTFLLVALAITLTRSLDPKSNIWWSVGSGVLLGTALLTRGILVFFPFFLLAAILFLKPLRRLKALKVLSVAVVVAGLTLSPWVIRNFHQSGRFIPLSTYAFSVAYHGFYFSERCMSDEVAKLDRAASIEREELVASKASDLEQESNPIVREWRKEQIARTLWFEKILESPSKTFLRYIRNLALTWFMNFNRWSIIVSLFLHLPLLILFMIGLFRIEKKARANSAILLLMILYFPLIHALLYPHVRYITPVIPLVMVFIASTFIKKAGREQSPPDLFPEESKNHYSK